MRTSQPPQTTATPDDPEWYRIAHAARPKLEAIPRGVRQAGVAEVAKEFGVESLHTLRKYVAAANFLDDLSANERALLKRKRDLPVAAVEIAARWYAYDKAAALQALEGACHGYHTVATLRAAEQKARSESSAPRRGRSLGHLLRERIASTVESLVHEGARKHYIKATPRSYEPRKLDFLFQAESDEHDRIAVAVFGPFGDEQQYFYKEDEYLTRILGLSTCFEKVVGIVPIHKEWGTNFAEWLRHHRLERRVSFHYLDLATLKIHSPEPIHKSTLNPRSDN